MNLAKFRISGETEEKMVIIRNCEICKSDKNL